MNMAKQMVFWFNNFDSVKQRLITYMVSFDNIAMAIWWTMCDNNISISINLLPHFLGLFIW